MKVYVLNLLSTGSEGDTASVVGVFARIDNARAAMLEEYKQHKPADEFCVEWTNLEEEDISELTVCYYTDDDDEHRVWEITPESVREFEAEDEIEKLISDQDDIIIRRGRQLGNIIDRARQVVEAIKLDYTPGHMEDEYGDHPRSAVILGGIHNARDYMQSGFLQIVDDLESEIKEITGED